MDPADQQKLERILKLSAAAGQASFRGWKFLTAACNVEEAEDINVFCHQSTSAPEIDMDEFKTCVKRLVERNLDEKDDEEDDEEDDVGERFLSLDSYFDSQVEALTTNSDTPEAVSVILREDPTWTGGGDDAGSGDALQTMMEGLAGDGSIVEEAAARGSGGFERLEGAKRATAEVKEELSLSHDNHKSRGGDDNSFESAGGGEGSERSNQIVGKDQDQAGDAEKGTNSGDDSTGGMGQRGWRCIKVQGYPNIMVFEREGDLIRSYTMKTFHLAYNVHYNLYICEDCHSGIARTALSKHLGDETTLAIVKEDYNDRTKNLDDRKSKHSRPICSDTTQTIKDIEAELKRVGIDAKKNAAGKSMDDWTKTKNRCLTEPISGVMVYLRGACCPVKGCHHAHPTVNKVSAHLKEHKNAPTTRTVREYLVYAPIQSASISASHFSYHRLDQEFIRILPGPSDVSAIPPVQQQGPSVAEQMARKKEALCNGSTLAGFVEPLLQTLGIHRFLQRFDPEDLLRLRQNASIERCGRSRRLDRLLFVAWRALSRDMELVTGANVSIRHSLLITRSVDDLPSYAVFTPPQTKTVRRYYTACLCNFLYCVMLQLAGPTRSKDGESFYNFTGEQKKALRILWKSLALENPTDDDIATAEESLYLALYSIFFPEDISPSQVEGKARAGFAEIDGQFHSPLVSYMALLTLKADEEGYRTVLHVPPALVRLQFFFRLVAFHKTTKVKVTSGNWMADVFNPFVRKFLRQHMLSPYSTLRNWIIEFSHLAFKIRRPATIAHLNLADNLIQFANHTLSFDRYKRFIGQSINKLEGDIYTKVLLELSLKELGIDLNLEKIQENEDITTPAFSPLIHDASTYREKSLEFRLGLDNDDSFTFFNALVKSRKLGNSTETSIDFDAGKVRAYLKSTKETMLFLWIMIHTTHGLPERGTEASLFQLINTLSRRHLFYVRVLNTLKTRSNYHKGMMNSHEAKEIDRIIPRRLAILLYIMLRIIRPIEILFVFYLSDSGDTQRKMASNLSHFIFAGSGKPFTSRELSLALQKWSQDGLGVPINIKIYRHLATVFQRHFLVEELERLRQDETSEVIARLKVAADLQAGHTQHVSEKHYGIIENVTYNKTGSVTQRIDADFSLVSLAWHNMLGVQLKTSFLEDDITNSGTVLPALP